VIIIILVINIDIDVRIIIGMVTVTAVTREIRDGGGKIRTCIRSFLFVVVCYCCCRRISDTIDINE